MGKVNVLKRGNVYQYKFEIAPVDGKRKFKNKSGFLTKNEAMKEGIKAYTEYMNTGHAFTPNEISYSDYLDYWMKEHCEVNLKYHTIEAYKSIIRIHVKPKIGHYKLSTITTATLQEFINKVYLDGSYSKNFLKNILKVLKTSFGYAYEIVHFIKSNPADKVRLPRYDIPDSDPAHIFTQEEIEKILDRFKDIPYIYYSFLTAYYTGMRVSEVYGLTWDNIDFDKKTITVNKNIIKKNKYGLPKRYCITKGHSVEVWSYGTCKNPQSQRTINIGDTLVKALKDYKKLQQENREYYGESYLKHYEKRIMNEYTNRPEIKIVDAKAEIKVDLPEAKLVFVRANGDFRGTESPRHAFKVINYELGIPCRFHDFRDTHATRLIEQGADIKAVSKRLGHSTIMTTYNIYVRVTNKMETETVSKFEDYANTLDIPPVQDIEYQD